MHDRCIEWIVVGTFIICRCLDQSTDYLLTFLAPANGTMLVAQFSLCQLPRCTNKVVAFLINAAIIDMNESSTLFERLFTNADNRFQFLTTANAMILFAIFDNSISYSLVQSSYSSGYFLMTILRPCQHQKYRNNGTDAVLRSTPTKLTHSRTTDSRHRFSRFSSTESYIMHR
jgi:hypothetical protein